MLYSLFFFGPLCALGGPTAPPWRLGRLLDQLASRLCARCARSKTDPAATPTILGKVGPSEGAAGASERPYRI